MEGPLEAKESTTATEEPIKSEAPVQSPGSSERSDGAVSPPPNCSICLGKLINTSFTDSCLHQFCFTCLLQWSKIKTECPLCKQTFKSIIHNVRSEEDYDQYHVPRELGTQVTQQPQVMATLDLNLEVDNHWDVHRFFYRTTMTGDRRRALVFNPEQLTRREPIPSIVPHVSRVERRRRRANPTDFRRTVYRLGIWATLLPDEYGRFRECSAVYYRREPSELIRLVPWLNRELNVLLNSPISHIAFVRRCILRALRRYDIRSPEFRDMVRPHLGIRTEHFVHELHVYARTNVHLDAYDQSVTYIPQGLSNEYVNSVVSPTSSSSSTSSDNSDVRVLDEAIDLRVNTEMPSVGPHPISMPGPSTIRQAFQFEMPYTAPDVLTISSNSSASDDECEVIGYVKPRHERTPEIIELVSSDPEEVPAPHVVDNVIEPPVLNFYAEPSEPSTSHSVKRRSVSSSTDSDSESDNNYVSKRRSRRCESRSRKSSKRGSSSKRRNRSPASKNQRRERILSSSSESEINKRPHKLSVYSNLKYGLRSSSDSMSQEPEGKKGEDKRSNKLSVYSNFKYGLRSSSDSMSQEPEGKKREDKRPSEALYSMRCTLKVRKDLIKREDRYSDVSTSSDSSSSDTEEDMKASKSRKARKSKRNYTGSSDFDSRRCNKITRTKSSLRDADRKEQSYERQSRSTSSAESLCNSQKDKNKGRSDSHRDTRERGSHDESNSTSRDSSRKKHMHTSKTRIRRVIESSSDSEDCFRSSSQCSAHSNKSYVRRKRSKHKDKYKSKDMKRSPSRSFSSSRSSSSISNSSTVNSSESEMRATSSKHSDSKVHSSSKDRHKSRKSSKGSKHRRSQSDTKSKSKKKRRRVRSSSGWNSE